MRDSVRIQSIRSSRLRIRIRIHYHYLHFAMRCNVAQFISCVFGVDGTITISDFYTVDHDILRKHCPLLLLLACLPSVLPYDFRIQMPMAFKSRNPCRRSPEKIHLISICHRSSFFACSTSVQSQPFGLLNCGRRWKNRNANKLLKTFDHKNE